MGCTWQSGESGQIKVCALIAVDDVTCSLHPGHFRPRAAPFPRHRVRLADDEITNVQCGRTTFRPMFLVGIQSPIAGRKAVPFSLDIGDYCHAGVRYSFWLERAKFPDRRGWCS